MPWFRAEDLSLRGSISGSLWLSVPTSVSVFAPRCLSVLGSGKRNLKLTSLQQTRTEKERNGNDKRNHTERYKDRNGDIPVASCGNQDPTQLEDIPWPSRLGLRKSAPLQRRPEGISSLNNSKSWQPPGGKSAKSGPLSICWGRVAKVPLQSDHTSP